MFGGEFAAERERLALGERLWDPGTIAALVGVGVGPGWHCLEIGAGLGSIARWLADRVGARGSVTAVDLRTDRLAPLREHGVLVHELDVVHDPLPGAGYDLIHARLVLQHLPERGHLLERLAGALRPGGVLLLEDTDVLSLFSHPTQPAFLRKAKLAAYAIMAGAGYEARCGLLNVGGMIAAGLMDVTAEGRAAVVRGGSDEARWYALWLEHLRPRLLADGGLAGPDLDLALAQLADPRNIWLSQVMVTASGRRPGR